MKFIYKLIAVLCITLIFVIGFHYFQNRNSLSGHRVVICIPIYGQSLALGEEAIRITNFDSLRINYKGRILNEHLNYLFGGYSEERWKRSVKRLLQIHRRSFELSLYRMSESLATQFGNDTIICIFPGGMGESPIHNLTKQETLYPRLIFDIKDAYERSKRKGWEFFVPAICWMQGESDIIDYTNEDYKKTIRQILSDLNHDIKEITHQKSDVKLVCYQSNVVSIAKDFNRLDYKCVEMIPSQNIVDLINEDSLFEASGPTYPYNFINEYLHIDAVGQQMMGQIQAQTVYNIVKGKGKTYGLIPQSLTTEGNDVLVHFRVPSPPLVFDTISILPIRHYGFSVITKDNKDILSEATIEGECIRLRCSLSPIDCKVRYAVNGEPMKSGARHGPRGNLRDSKGEQESIMIQEKTYPVHNWCYQFDLLCK